MAFRVPLSGINASDGNVTYAQGSVLRVGAGGNVNAVGSIIVSATGNVGVGTSSIAVGSVAQIEGAMLSKVYKERSVGALTSTLAPSSGNLTVDVGTGAVILGSLNATATGWAFTNVDISANTVTTVTMMLKGSTSFLYGDNCFVNGTRITNGPKWPGGSSPTPSNNYDLLTFNIVSDSAANVQVFGSAISNMS